MLFGSNGLTLVDAYTPVRAPVCVCTCLSMCASALYTHILRAADEGSRSHIQCFASHSDHVPAELPRKYSATALQCWSGQEAALRTEAVAILGSMARNFSSTIALGTSYSLVSIANAIFRASHCVLFCLAKRFALHNGSRMFLDGNDVSKRLQAIAILIVKNGVVIKET